MFRNLKQNSIKIFLSSVLVLSTIFVFVPAIAGAQNTTEPTNGDNGGFVLCGNNAGDPCTIGHLFAAFIVIINYLIAMAGFVAVAAIVFAGFTMVYSQGQDQLKAAKGRFAGAVVGLILVAAAYLLINSLLSGRFSIGICQDKLILTSPLEYIKEYENRSCS